MVRLCPICGERLDMEVICYKCQFDTSTDHENYRTVGYIPIGEVSTYQKRKTYEEAKFISKQQFEKETKKAEEAARKAAARKAAEAAKAETARKAAEASKASTEVLPRVCGGANTLPVPLQPSIPTKKDAIHLDIGLLLFLIVLSGVCFVYFGYGGFVPLVFVLLFIWDLTKVSGGNAKKLAIFREKDDVCTIHYKGDGGNKGLIIAIDQRWIVAGEKKGGKFSARVNATEGSLLTLCEYTKNKTNSKGQREYTVQYLAEKRIP